VITLCSIHQGKCGLGYKADSAAAGSDMLERQPVLVQKRYAALAQAARRAQQRVAISEILEESVNAAASEHIRA
jgi:hypothetical protein